MTAIDNRLNHTYKHQTLPQGDDTLAIKLKIIIIYSSGSSIS